MGRPQKVIQRKSSGVFFVQPHIAGRRVTKSLKTKDQLVATKSAAQAIRELQEEADRQGRTKWTADEPAILWDIPSKPDGAADFANAKRIETTWGDIADPEDLKVLSWRDLTNEAVRVRKANKGEDYSDGWYSNVGFEVHRAPFGPL